MSQIRIEQRWVQFPLLIIATIVTALLIWRFIDSSYLLLPLLPLTLLGMYYYPKLPKITQRAYVLFLAVIIAVFSLALVQSMRENIENPREWDFLGFWLHGTTAAQGKNFYDPANAQQLTQNMVVSDDFRIEIVDVGFWYPPPSIFIFLPLGWFDLQTALLLWYVANSLVLIVTIILLHRWLLPQSGRLGLLFVASLMLMLHSVYTTVSYAQTNFLLLLAIVLFVHDRHIARAGLWLALAVLIKPFAAVLLVYLILRRKWSAIGVVIATAILASLATILVFGTDNFLSYFRGSSVTKLPDYIYTEITNPSLLATILRVTSYEFGSSSPMLHPVFLITGLAMGLITLWSVYRLNRSNEDLTISLLLVFAIIVYPASQLFYSVLLILPVLWLWQKHRLLFGSNWVIPFGLITAIYVLLVVRDGGLTFGANLLVWGILIWISWKVKQDTSLVGSEQLSLQS